MGKEEIFKPSMLLEDPVFTVEHPKLGTIKFKELSVKEVIEFLKIEDLGERGFKMTLRRLAKANPDVKEEEFTDSKVNYMILDEIAAAIQEYQNRHFRDSRRGFVPMSTPNP